MQDTPRILVVDDEPGVRAALMEILHPKYQVMTAESGVTALHVLSTSPADLVLLDLMLPGLPGTEVCRALLPLRRRMGYVFQGAALFDERQHDRDADHQAQEGCGLEEGPDRPLLDRRLRKRGLSVKQITDSLFKMMEEPSGAGAAASAGGGSGSSGPAWSPTTTRISRPPPSIASSTPSTCRLRPLLTSASASNFRSRGSSTTTWRPSRATGRPWPRKLAVTRLAACTRSTRRKNTSRPVGQYLPAIS